MTDEFAIVRNHFIASLEQEGLQSQLRYAAEQCSDTPELLAKLEEMIRAHHRTEGFLASAGDGIQTEPDLSERVGRQIGPYKLLQKIGEGGMGMVFMAEQSEPMERRVALKIIKPGMDSRQVISRFEAERQALAMMDHPNIARVLDAGTTENERPFFAMELVNGLPITEFCDEHHLEARERLALFIPVCQAVQHAHQKGIIHRDLKPSNILVAMYDERPVPKVIDFGVAKAVGQRLTDKTMFTALGQIVGTIDYMSPEQVQRNQLDIDTRSDIYSLGVVLYELLAGERPFDRKRLHAAAFEELLKIIREEEPPRPSIKLGSSQSLPAIAANRRIDPQKLGSLIKGDLDWIVMKALSKDRSQRYETANGLARDVQRFLNSEAVVARPPSWSYLSSRFIQRNRGLVVATCAILCALMVGLGTSLALAAWALKERSHARLQEGIASSAEQKALDSLLEARLAFANLNIWSGKPGQQRESLMAIGEAADLARSNGDLSKHLVDLRSKAIAAMSRIDTRRIKAISTSQEAAAHSAISSDFGTIAFRIREPDQDFVTVRDTETPIVERLRIPVPFNTRSAYHDQLFLELSAHGRFLLIYSQAQGVLLWDLQTNRELALFDQITEPGCFSANEKYFFVGIFDQSTRTYVPTQLELPSMRLVRKFETQVLRNKLVVSNCGRYLACSTADELTVHELINGKRLVTLSIESELPYHEIAWSRSGNVLAVTVDSNIRVFDMFGCLTAKGPNSPREPPVPMVTLRGSESYVSKIQFHPVHEPLLVSSGWDATVRLWNVYSGGLQISLPASHPEFSTDGLRLKVAQLGGLEIHEFYSGDICRWISWQGQKEIAFDPSQQLLCVASVHSGCQLWSVPGLEPLGRICAAPAPGVAWNTANQSLLVGNDYGLFEFPVAVSNSKLQVGPSRFVLSNSSAPFSSIHVSSDGQHIVALEDETRGPVILDRQAGVGQKWMQPQQTNAVSLAPNSRWFAITYADRVVVTNCASLQTVAEFPLASFSGVKFSDDSILMVIASTNQSQIFQTKNWTQLGNVDGTERILEPAISPDGQLMVVPAGANELRLIETTSQKLLTRLQVAEAPRLYYVAKFSPNGDWLCLAHESNGATVWNIQEIRQRLASMELDWQPPYSAVSTRSRQPLQGLEMEPGEYEEFVELIKLEGELEPNTMRDVVNSKIDAGVDYADAFALRARTLRKLNDHAAAAKDYHQAGLRAPYVGIWRFYEAVARERIDDWAGAFEILFELSNPEFYERPADCFVRCCELICTHPELLQNDDRFAAELLRWHDACSGVDTNSHIASVIQALSTPRQVQLREAIGLAYFGLGDDESALPMLEANQAGSSAGLFARATLQARAGDLKTAQELYDAALEPLQQATEEGRSKAELHFLGPIQRAAEAALAEARKGL